MSIRESFVEAFGEDNAVRVEESSIGHLAEDKTNHGNDNWGTDPFRYHFMNCIAHECFDQYAKYHGFTDLECGDVIIWSRENADLLQHDGDMPDYMALLAGMYFPWIDWDKAGQTAPDGWESAEVERQRAKFLTPEQKTEEMKEMTEKMIKMLNHHGLWEGPLP